MYEANRPHTPAPSSWQPVKQGTIANIPYRKLNVPGFTSAEQLGLVELGQRVFRAKCLDINVPMSRDKEERFVRLFCQRCTSGVVGLHVLNASNMKLGLFALREICEYLVDDNLYTHLYLGGNNFGDTGARLLYELLSVNHVIEVLDVKATGMGQQGMVMLCAAVAQPESVIHTLNASSSGKSEGRNYLGIDGAQALGELLSVSETLQKLSLQNCGLVTEAVPGFVRGLKANDSLLTLDLSTNDLAHRNFPKVCQGLRTCKHLTSLSLANNMLGSTGAMTLAKVLRGMETLKTLDLRQNSIGLRGFALLSDSFSRLVNLEAFLVDDNLFAEQSRMAIDKITLEDYKRREEINLAARRVGIYDKRLSSHISFATALRTISLSKSRVSDGLVVDLFATLNKTTTLQTVHLSGNLISDEGAIAMADFLRINTSLTLLNVSDNQIGDIGGYQMSVALLQNPALTKLSLAVNNVGKRTCEALIDVLSRHRIFHVSLQGNPIPFQELRRAQVLSAQNLTTYQENSHLRFKKEVDILKNQQMRLRKVLVKVEEAAVEEVEIERELEQCKGVSFKFRQEQKEETRRGEDDLKAVMTEAREQMEMEYHAGHAVVNKNREMEARITHMKRMIEKENRGKQSLTRKLKIARQDFDRVRDENANFISGLFKENENEKKERMMVKRVLGKVIDQCETFIFQMETRVSASVRDDKRRKANSYKSRGVDSKTDGSNDSDYGHSFDTNTDDNQEGAKKKKGAGLKKRGKKGKKKTKTPRGEGSEVYQLKLQGDQNAKRKKKGKKRK